jgi:hypothetical protein
MPIFRGAPVEMRERPPAIACLAEAHIRSERLQMSPQLHCEDARRVNAADHSRTNSAVQKENDPRGLRYVPRLAGGGTAALTVRD